MGLAGRFAWANTYSKKQCRSLFWRVRAAVKKAVKGGGKQHPNFQYDPSSYALNFDDGGGKEAIRGNGSQHVKLQDFLSSASTSTWVYVLW
ncbi:hypothetical protein Ancab_005283 [Ancistrocladus abbreviatus]